MGKHKKSKLPIAEFKRKLATEKEIGDVFDCFFDHFASDPEFLERGHSIEVPKHISEYVHQIAMAVWKGAPVLAEFQLIEVPTLQMIHGTVMLNDNQATIIWMNDMNAGVIALVRNSFTGEMVFSRMSVTPAPSGRPN